MPAFSVALGFNAGTSFSSFTQPLIVTVAFAGVARFGTWMAGGLGRSGDCGVGAVCGACAYTVMDAAAANATVSNLVFMCSFPRATTCKAVAVLVNADPSQPVSGGY